MNQILEQIVRAVAKRRVTRKIELLAARLIEHEERQAELAAARPKGAAQAFADDRRAREELEAERRHLDLVRKVRSRDGNQCQLCDGGGPKPSDPVDPHHLEMGAAKTIHERLDNVLCAHRSCHDAYHMSARPFIARVRTWAARHGYRLPNRKEFRDV